MVLTHQMLIALRRIKKHHPKDVGKKPKIVDLTSGEFGFHSADLPKEGHILRWTSTRTCPLAKRRSSKRKRPSGVPRASAPTPPTTTFSRAARLRGETGPGNAHRQRERARARARERDRAVVGRTDAAHDCCSAFAACCALARD